MPTNKKRICIFCRSQWSRGITLEFAGDHLLGLRIRIPPVEWTYISGECCVLSGTDICDRLITHPGTLTEFGVSNECDHEAQ